MRSDLKEEISQRRQPTGWRPLVPNFPVPRMALGGVTTSLMQQQLRGDVGAPIDYDRLAQATARALRQSPPITKWSDFKAAENRANFTDQNSNS